MRNYSYKLYTSAKNKKLHTLIDSGACIWNHCVHLNNRYYRLYKRSIPKGNLEKHICKLRKSNPYWMSLNSQTVQEVVQRYDVALVGFFKKQRKRRPKIKKWVKFSSIVLKQSGYKLSGNTLTLNGIANFKFHLSRPYGDVRNIRIKRTPVGDFFIVICSKELPEETKQYNRKSNDVAPIGIDFGLKTFLTISDGKSIESPLFFKRESKKIKAASKRLSGALKGSNNRKRRKVELAIEYRQLNFLRDDHAWKLAHKLCSTYSHIFLEDLNIAAMQKMWGRKISDLCFSDFICKLKHIACKYGTLVYQIDRFYPSSKTCYDCGTIYKELSLNERLWECKSCNTLHDRDKNASKNILREGILSFQRKNKTNCKKLASFACMEQSSTIYVEEYVKQAI